MNREMSMGCDVEDGSEILVGDKRDTESHSSETDGG